MTPLKRQGAIENAEASGISEMLDQLAISTLNNCLAALSADGDFWPLAVLADETDFDIQQFSDDGIEECYQAACDYVANARGKASGYVIAFDGHAELEFGVGCCADGLETQVSDALILEFGEAGSSRSYSMITPYRRIPATGEIEIIGDTALVEEDQNLLM